MWFVYASAAALCFGMRGILYQWTSRKPLDRNLMLFGVYLSGVFIALALNLIMKQNWTNGALVGILIGLFSFIANTAMYKGFAVGRASLIALLSGLPPIIVVCFAYLLWGESLSWGQAIAFGVILSGLLIIRYSSDLSWSNMQGAQWGLLMLISFGITDVASKQAVLWEGETFPTLIYMYITGSILFLGSWMYGIIRKNRNTTVLVSNLAQDETAATSDAPPPWSISRTITWGMFVGIFNISGMAFLLPAFRLGITGLVSAVIAMNVLIVLLYARLFLHEQFSRKEVVGITLTLLGMISLRLVG